MLKTQFPNVLAFVEGHMERIFINNNFNYVSVITVSNGIGWTTNALAKQISTLYKARNFFGDAVLVWVDREKRSESATEISNCIKETLLEAGAVSEKIHILIADKMSENIILADEFLIRAEFGDENYTYEYEGKNGKHILSSLYKNAGKNYRETSTGVALLKKTRLGACAAKSASVNALLETLKLPCWWLEHR